MPSSAQEGERDALTGRQQERCHVILAAESNKMAAISHGFELSHTLSCAEATKRNSHKEAQKAQNDYSLTAFILRSDFLGASAQ